MHKEMYYKGNDTSGYYLCIVTNGPLLFQQLNGLLMSKINPFIRCNSRCIEEEVTLPSKHILCTQSDQNETFVNKINEIKRRKSCDK